MTTRRFVRTNGAFVAVLSLARAVEGCSSDPSTQNRASTASGGSSKSSVSPSVTSNGTPNVTGYGKARSFAFKRSMDLPGQGMAIAYAPDGRHIAVGGHVRDGMTGQRYDTKIDDTKTSEHVKRFDCHDWHDANDGTLLDTLTGHADVVPALAFSADGCSLPFIKSTCWSKGQIKPLGYGVHHEKPIHSCCWKHFRRNVVRHRMRQQRHSRHD